MSDRSVSVRFERGIHMLSIARDSGLRIAGSGGAGFFIQSLRLPSETGVPRLGVDMSILSPDRLVTYLAREVPPGFTEELGAFLREASVAEDGSPAESFEDGLSGIVISATPMDGMWVEFEVQVVMDLEQGVLEFDGINFETTRASLLLAAQAVERLDQPRRNPDEED